MGNRWFRLYNEILNDPKVDCLPPPLFKHLIKIWCLFSQSDEELTIKLVSYALRVSSKKATKILSQLSASGLLDATETGYIPHNWHKRQYISDSSTPRVKRFRERSGNTQSGVTATPPDTDTDTDTERKEGVVTPLYAFNGKTIKLTAPDFERWEKAFSRLDLRAELEARDAWLSTQEEDIRKHWFQSTATFLRNQNAKAVPKRVRDLEAEAEGRRASEQRQLAARDGAIRLTPEQREANLRKLKSALQASVDIS